MTQLRALGIGEAEVRAQLVLFQRGQKHTRLERACTLGDGIVRLARGEMESLSALFSASAQKGRAMEFIPASGAATRMFKGLTATLKRADSPAFADLEREAAHDPDARETVEWFRGLRRFPFFAQLSAAVTRSGRDPDALLAAQDYRPILESLLSPAGLHFSDLPKALIPFHLYADGEGARTALEEHLAEASGLVKDAEGLCRLHFTVSPDHERDIRAALENARRKYSASGTRFEITLSRQLASTDTLAVDQGNAPLRNADDTLCLRPGGHGALLENLMRSGGDIVFIKNIDNLVPGRLRAEVLLHRKALGGYLVRLRERIFAHLGSLRALPLTNGKPEDNPDTKAGSAPLDSSIAEVVEAAAAFAERNLDLLIPESLRARAQGARAVADKAAYLLKALDRPLRVCAMVQNQGEPGGGPFWVREGDGSLRAQIVETAQVDTRDPQQKGILESATHFNPVDLACSLRDAAGDAYDLRRFVDAEACFISVKSKDGKILKALELPGLWNGSMAYWNTVFVEMPVTTFNPVKTVNDLLRPNHQ